MQRRSAFLAALVLAMALVGCAGFDTVTSEVATYGAWPADRQPGRFAFERLPSQQAQPARQAELEAAAARALEAAGFTAAPDAEHADMIVQIGARVSYAEMSPWDDPLWWRWGPGYWRGAMWGAAWPGPPYAYYYPVRYRYGGYYYGGYGGYYGGYYTRFERSVAVLLRDRQSGTPLYEAHALSEGNLSGGSALFTAMFEAALKDFPAKGAPNPRLVTVPRVR